MPRKPKDETPLKVVPPCKYAYDPDDEVCSQCNGINFVDNGKTYAATDCRGYEALEEIEDEPAVDYEPEVVENNEPPLIDFKKIQRELEEPQSDPEIEPLADEPIQVSTVTQNEPKIESESNLPVLEPFEIHAESAITIQIKSANGMDQWYKVVYGESRRVPEGYDVEVARADLWDAVNGEVDNQAAEILKIIKG